MSVQNPERVVTKQDLADFYGEIRPYLGGMPEILANKFAKGDLYSTDEKMIGQWIDGKPLYQKTFDLGSQIAISTEWTTLSQINYTTYNMDVVVDSKAIKGEGSSSGNNVVITVFAGAETGSNNLLVKAPTAVTVRYLTLQYTKTTDSAISIGSDTDYSTTEKIIGTWIDGKPVYQLTVEGESFSTGTNWTNYPTPSGLNVDTIISAILHRDDGDIVVNPIQFGFENDTFRGYASENLNSMSGYTVQYTKTTD